MKLKTGYLISPFSAPQIVSVVVITPLPGISHSTISGADEEDEADGADEEIGAL